MRTIFVCLLLVLCLSDGEAQWRKVADFRGMSDAGLINEYITCIYFLDLPGPPRIGFVGTASELFRTSDGGESWTKVWGNGAYWAQFVTSITFADSLNGWFSFSLGDYDLYRTTDGGFNWTPVELPMNTAIHYGPNSIAYATATGRLYAAMGDSDRILYSTDGGKTWPYRLPYGAQSFSFSSVSCGIVPSGFEYDSSGHFLWGFLWTTDGGLSWDSAAVGHTSFFKPLAVKNSPVCFACGNDSTTKIFRSDDYGAHWRQIYDFGPSQDSNYHDLNPYGTGVIAGDLAHLYIQTDLGMYVSTDEGQSWKRMAVRRMRCSWITIYSTVIRVSRSQVLTKLMA